MDYAPGIKEVAILDETILSGSGQKYKTPVIIGCGNNGIIKDAYCDNPTATGTISFTGDPFVSIHGVICVKTAGDIGTMEYELSKDGGETFENAQLSRTGLIDIGGGVFVEFGGTGFTEDDEYHFTTIGGMKPNTLYILTPNNYEGIVGENSELAIWLKVYFNFKVKGRSPTMCLGVRPVNDRQGEIGNIVKKPANILMTGDFAVSGNPTRNRDLVFEVVKSGNASEAKVAIYDGSNLIQEPFVLPADGDTFLVDSILFTVANGDLTPIIIVDNANTGDATVGITGTQTANIDLLVEMTTGGNVGTAVFSYSKDNGTTWTENVITATSVDIGDGINLTFDDAGGTLSFAIGDKWKSTIRVKNFNTGDKLKCQIKAPYSSNRLSAITENGEELRTKIKKKESYGFFVLPFACELGQFNTMKTILNEREASRKSLAWYSIQTKELDNDNDLFNEDTGLFPIFDWFTDIRCNPVGTYHDFTVGDKTYKTPSTIFMAAKRHLQDVYESPASASEKSMENVGKLYNEELFLDYEQDFYKNKITITHQRSGEDNGWFFSNPYLKSAKGSRYDRVHKIAIIQKAMDLLRIYLLKHVEDPLKAPSNAVGLALTTLMLNAKTYIAREMNAEINDVIVKLKQPTDIAVKELIETKDIQVAMKVFDIPIPTTFSLFGDLGAVQG